MLADQWYIKVTFIDGDPLLYDLGSDEDSAKQLFRDTRRQLEKAQNNPGVHDHVDIGWGRWEASMVMYLELIAPGSEIDEEDVAN